MEVKPRILIIDDNPQNIQLLATILDENGYDIEVGLSGYDALNTLKEESFDLLLLDVMMPAMNGFQVCSEIRKQNKYDNMPIIFISAKSDKESIVNGFKAGGQDYVNKPFHEEELLARISTHINLKKNREKLTLINATLEEKIEERTKELSEAYKKVKKSEESRNKFLSFLGTEIMHSFKQMEEHVYAIKLSAESSQLSGLINDYADSYSRLKRISTMAGKIASLQSKEQPSKLLQVDLTTLIDVSLSSSDSLIDSKDLEIEFDLPDELLVDCVYELLKDSMIAMLEAIVSIVPNNSTIKFSTFDNEDLRCLSVEFEMKKTEADELPEELKLFISYTELIMLFSNGGFNVQDIKEEKRIYNWNFKHKTHE
jgi:DNA-binding response OmpR family regulator